MTTRISPILVTALLLALARQASAQQPVAAALDAGTPHPLEVAPAEPPPAPPPGSARYRYLAIIEDDGVGASHSGDHLVFQLGGAWYGVEPFADRGWLFQFGATLVARGGWLANQHPFADYVGGRGTGDVELGHRFQADRPWSTYLAARLAGDLSVLGHSGLALDKLNTINDSTGFGGVTATGFARVAAGGAFLDAGHSFVVTAFMEELGRAAGVFGDGVAFTGGGLAVRLDFPNGFHAAIEGFEGVSQPKTNAGLSLTDQTWRGELRATVRVFLGSHFFLGLTALLGRDSDHLVYTDTHKAFDTASAPDFSATLNLGLVPGGVR